MKTPRINRRQFFKTSAFGAGTLALPAIGLASVTATPSREAQATTVEAHKLAVPQPTFNAIASTTIFGPPTDISAGWDGTLWAIDASGAPHLYDPTSDAWLPHGDGIDAMAAIGDTLYVFRRGQYDPTTQQVVNSQYLTIDLGNNTISSNPTDVATTWPTLPDSFKLRLTGAANLSGKLVLFNGGWYLPADGSAPRAKLTALQGWPTTPNWVEGVIDAVVSNSSGAGSDGSVSAILTRGSEYIVVDFKNSKVTFGPAPISAGSGWKGSLPADWLTGGWDGAVYVQQNGANTIVVFRGTQVASFSEFGSTVVQPKYVASIYTNWPATWNPVLNHAPSGRMGNLWCSTTALSIVQHNGETWQAITGKSASVAVGQDNSVYAVSGDNQTIDTFVAGTGWVATATAPVQLTKVALGDAGHVFVLGNDGSVHRLVRSSGAYAYTQVPLGGGVPPPTHISANADGTLWHCTAGNPSAFRLISESTNPSAQIQLKGAGIVSGVNKVASTGFGAAHCLVKHSDGSTNVYRYDSPYVFKTPGSYELAWNPVGAMAHGLGRVFVPQLVTNTPDAWSIRIVAIDAQTGAELTSYTPPGDKTAYTGLVFDPVNELVYIGTATYFSGGNGTDNTTPGQIIALDARTLAVRWTFATKAGVDGTPVLNGTQLCFGDRTNTLYMIDTRAALAAAQANAAVVAKWTWGVPTRPAATHRMSTPLITNGKVYAVAWDLDTSAINGNQIGHYPYLAACDAATGQNGTARIGDFIGENVNKPLTYALLVSAPVSGKTLVAASPTTADAIYINAGFNVKVFPVDATLKPVMPTFALPGGQISTGLAFDDGSRLGANGLPSGGTDPTKCRVWCGDNVGNLWSLNYSLIPVDNTPSSIKSNTTIFTTPVLYKDPQSGLTALFGVFDNAGALQPSLYGFDPDNGNSASVPTGVTTITAIVPGASNGMVYVGGSPDYANPGNQPLQVMGIRVDELPQAARDFVIESQMMQDPDQNAATGDPSNHIPPSVARYQTHLTVVDDQKNPIPREPVKIWCDTPNTKITVDGVAYTVGPDDAHYAAVNTGVDGAVVITMDATDYFAPTLRVWAGFMDPFERIVVNADTEYHQRVMTAHANASDDDPQKVNLQTATNYNGQSLFTDDEKNQNPPTPQNVANSIQTADKGLGISNGGGSSKTLYRKMMRAMGVKHKNQKISVRWIDNSKGTSLAFGEGLGLGAGAAGTDATPEKYLAYADLQGAAHFPTNIPSVRTAPIASAIGLSFSRPNGDVTKAPVFSTLSHTDARAAIDALQGEPWKPSDPQSGLKSTSPFRKGLGVGMPARVFNIWQDFWNWLKGLFDKIAQVFLSIAEDILAGIQYIVNGILKVFKAIIKVLEDVFPFLGSFFKMLDKLIDDVQAALSVLFHFGEVIWTHKWLAGQFQSRINDLTNAITSTIEPAINTFIADAENGITGFFDQLKQDIQGGGSASGQPLSGLPGMGATPHTAFAARPGSAGPRSGGTSQAVQCSYGLRKFKAGLPSATSGSSALVVHKPASSSADPLTDFFTAFIARLTGDGDLAGTVNQLQSDFGNLFNASSAKQFFTTLLVSFLDLIETLIVGALAVVGAFFDGFLAVIKDAINAVLSVLTTTIDIPFISWLYKTLFGEPLTFLNLATLVVAIPITVLCRVVEGKYPSQLFPPVNAAGQMQIRSTAAAPAIVQRYLGIFVGILTMVQGTANAIGDSDGDEAPPIVAKVSLGVGLLIEAFTFPLIDNDASDVTTYDWAEYGVGLGATLSGILGINDFGLNSVDDLIIPYITNVLNMGLLAVTITAFVKDGKTDAATDLGFAAGLIYCIPGIANPIKMFGEEAALVVAVIDFVGLFVVGALQITQAVVGTSLPDPRPRRLFFPWVAYSPLPVTAHP